MCLGKKLCQIGSLVDIVALQVMEALGRVVDTLVGGDGHGEVIVDEIHGPLVHIALGIGKMQGCGAGVFLEQGDGKLQVREEARLVFLPGLALVAQDARVWSW